MLRKITQSRHHRSFKTLQQVLVKTFQQKICVSGNKSTVFWLTDCTPTQQFFGLKNQIKCFTSDSTNWIQYVAGQHVCIASIYTCCIVSGLDLQGTVFELIEAIDFDSTVWDDLRPGNEDWLKSVQASTECCLMQYNLISSTYMVEAFLPTCGGFKQSTNLGKLAHSGHANRLTSSKQPIPCLMTHPGRSG